MRLLPVNASEEDTIEAKRRFDTADNTFKAFDYAYYHTDIDNEGKVILSIVDGEVNNFFLNRQSGDKNTNVTEAILSIIYERFGDTIKTINFSDCKDQPKLPENVVEAVQNGKITLEGYKILFE